MNKEKIDLLERPTEKRGGHYTEISSFCFPFFHSGVSPPSISRDNALSDTLRNFGGFSVIKISAGKHTTGRKGNEVG